MEDVYMKKITILCICLLFAGTTIAAATPRLEHKTTLFALAPSGTFEGYIGIPEHQGHNETIVATMQGTWELRNRGGRFNGEWATENKTGTLRGGFGRNLMVGRISTTINETERSLPIIGFIRIQNNSFIGRGMSYIGPALYFWGDYT